MLSQPFPMRLFAVTFAAFALMFASISSLEAQTPSQTSYMPILQATDSGDIGLALSNPTLAEVTVTLTARDFAGAAMSGAGITNPATITLPASGQRALRAVEIFGTGISGKTGWVQLQSSSLAVKGFFLVFDSRVSFIDGAELQTQPSSRIIFPKVSGSASSPTTISFVHTGTGTVPFAALAFYDNNGTLVARNFMTLTPQSGFSGPITALMPEVAGLEGYAVLETTGTPFSSPVETLVGFETYRNNADVAALNAVPDSAATRIAYLPHLASGGGYTTRLSLVNYGFQAQTVKITADALEKDGVAQTPASVSVERTIPANGRLEEAASSLFSLSGSSLYTGYVKWETQGNTRGVIGYLDFGTTDGVLLSAVPAQATSYSDLFFSHIAEGLGYYTGIAFLNTNTQTTTINVDVFNKDGARVASTTVTLPSGQRRSRLFSELFPGFATQLGGYVRVTASRPVFSFELFGSRTSLSFLANVAAQGIRLQPQASGRTVSAATGANVISAATNASIAIPPGALETDTAVSLNAVAVSLPPPSPTQQVVASLDAQPSGTIFKIPVRLTFPLAAQLEPGTQIPVLIYTAQGTYENSGFIAIVDESGRTASAQVTHFTVFAVGVTTEISVTSVSPISGLAGTTVTIGGSGFSANAAENMVTFAGPENTSIAAEVTSASTTSLVVKVPANAVTGNLIVKVGTKTSVGVKFTVPVKPPAPSLSSISPTSLAAGTTSAELRVVGTSFHNTSVVRVDGSAVGTTLVDANLLLASLSGAALAPGVHKVTVYTAPDASAGGGGESGSSEYTVGFPIPTITSLSPASAESASGAIPVTIKGAGFTSSSVVLVDSAAISSTFVDSTTITITVSSETAKTLPIVVSNPAPGGGASGTAVFTFLEPPVGSITIISAANQSATVATTLPLEVELKKKNGALLGSFPVSFSVTAGNGSVTASATTDGQGRATVTVTLGTTAGANTIKVTAGTVTASFSATGTAGPATKVTLASSPASITAGGTGSTVSVRIEDQYGNLRTDAVNGITFSVSAGSGTLSASTATASGGLASTTFTSVTSGGNTITGAATGLTSGTASVTVNPGAPASLAKTGGDNQTGQAGVALTTALKAQIKDAFGNVVPGVTVTFSVVSGGGSVSPASATTNSSGEAQTTATPGGALGTQTFRAASTGLTSVDFNSTIGHGPASQLAIAAASTSIQAGVNTDLMVTAKDQFGNTATGATNTLTLAASPSSSVTFGSTSPSLSQGMATTTFKATTAASYTVTVTSSPALTSANAGITVSAAAASSLVSVSGVGQSGVKGTDLPATFVVKVVDAFGNPVSGVTVSFEAASGNGSTVTPSSQATGTNGQASTAAKLGTVAGQYLYRASVSGLTGSPVDFTATATNEAPTSVVQISTHSSAAVATTQTFTVEVRGSSGAAVPDVNVAFSRTAGDGKVDGGTADLAKVTGSDGRASVTLTLGNTAGTNTFKATVSQLTPVTVSITGTAGNATQLVKITADQSGEAGTQLSNALIVEARDQFDNPKSGVPVTFAVTSGSGAGATVSSTSEQTTGTDGRTSVTATLGTSAAPYTFSGTSSGLTGSPVTLSATATLTASKIELVSGNNQTVAPGISLLTPLKVKVTNAGNVAVPNVSVSWTAASGGGSVSSATSTTNSSGEAQITATAGSSAGTNTFTATKSGLTGSPVTFTATAKAFSNVTVNVQINSGSTAVGSYQVTITFNKDLVKVDGSNSPDADGNPVSNPNVLGAGGTTGFANPPGVINIENANSRITINSFQPVTNPSGTFTVARITFTPIRPGTVTLGTAPTTLLATTVTNTAGGDVTGATVTFSQSSFTID